MLRVESLVVRYGAVDAVKGVDLRVDAGEAVSLLGPNGAGKSSVVKALVGWEPAAEGRIEFDGNDVTRAQPWRRFALGLGVVPEGGRVFGDLTVEENLRVSARRADPFTGLELFPVLKERRNQRASTLSGGERQMLSVARALAGHPRLLVLDEVSFGLMPKAVVAIFDALARLLAEGISLLVIEQEETRALRLCSRAYVLSQGVVSVESTTEQLAGSDQLRAAYFGTGPAAE
jgi:branched-chain amino acid transport system ATP-binding protein